MRKEASVISVGALMAQEESSRSITTTLVARVLPLVADVFEDCFVVRVTGMSSDIFEIASKHSNERSIT